MDEETQSIQKATASTPGTSEETVPIALVAKRIEELVDVSALDVVREFIGRFIWAGREELDALTVWIVHTYVYKAYPATPRLHVSADREDAGKSTVLNVARALSSNGIKTANASMPSIYTIIEQEHPTLFFDEADNMFTASGSSARRKDLIGILNDGYTDEGYVLRQVDRVAVKWPCFVVCAFAGIGRLPKTMESRSVRIRMKPKPSGVKLERWRKDDFAKEAQEVADYAKNWITSRGPELDPRPKIPEALGDNRAAEIWEALIGIGDLEGENWGRRIRAAALKLVCGISSIPKKTPAEDLIETVAKNTAESAFLPTGDLVSLLATLYHEDGSLPWATWLGDPIVASRQIASLLRPYGIESQQKWLDGENRRGYNMADFHMWTERISGK
jgi:hypothetical protein